MRRRHILKSLPFAVAGWAAVAHAQDSQGQIAQRFAIAASKHKRELEDLYSGRNVLPPALTGAVSSRDIAKLLGAYPTNLDRRMAGITYADNTAVLFYSYEAGTLQVWLLNAGGIQAYDQQKRSRQRISDAIASLRASLNVDSLQRSRIPHQRGIQAVATKPTVRKSQKQAIGDLTRILLPPAIARELDFVEHLVVVPVLEIGTVPYPILKPFGDHTFLVDRMSISIAPSLYDLGQTLDYDRLLTRGLGRFPLVVGNPYLPENDGWAVPPLPGAEAEARAVARTMNTMPLLGKDATKTRVLDLAQRASLLYFATHGIASSQNPLSGGFLMLSADQFEQGWWTAKEIQNTQLVAALAVLSACQTGLGQTHDAGIIGLARAFQIAGVPRVVMSLWSVDDEATSALMQAFMKHLKTQIVSEALRQAMLEVKKVYSAPSLWASFMMFGTPR